MVPEVCPVWKCTGNSPTSHSQLTWHLPFIHFKDDQDVSQPMLPPLSLSLDIKYKLCHGYCFRYKDRVLRLTTILSLRNLKSNLGQGREEKHASQGPPILPRWWASILGSLLSSLWPLKGWIAYLPSKPTAANSSRTRKQVVRPLQPKYQDQRFCSSQQFSRDWHLWICHSWGEAERNNNWTEGAALTCQGTKAKENPGKGRSWAERKGRRDSNCHSQTLRIVNSIRHKGTILGGKARN